MKSHHSFKRKIKYNWQVGLVRKKHNQKILNITVVTMIAAVLVITLLSRPLFNASDGRYSDTSVTKTQGLHLPNLNLLSPVHKSNSNSQFVSTNFVHQSIISTIFWVGESADSSNGYIANSASAWDEKWMNHFGGLDDPTHRNGYISAGFSPKENPFYIALPYNDISPLSNRKNSALNCLTFTPNRQDNYSWCKNVWVMIRHGQKVAYAQWEDVGPFEEDDIAYVFGSKPPRNRTDAKAGIDASPAVRDYLGLAEVDKVDWAFVNGSVVPDGPWKQVVTTSLGSSLN